MNANQVAFHERHDREKNKSCVTCAERFEWFTIVADSEGYFRDVKKLGYIRRPQTKNMLIIIIIIIIIKILRIIIITIIIIIIRNRITEKAKRSSDRRVWPLHCRHDHCGPGRRPSTVSAP